MTMVRLLADDLTGALDTAAAFVPLTGPMPVFWTRAPALPSRASAAFDGATREGPAADATRLHGEMADALRPADIAFKKIDSLLRGHAIAEIAALMGSGAWTHAVLAPAFPFQGRITRNGRQHRTDTGGDWIEVGENLVQALRAEGQLTQCSDMPNPGVTVMDAETNDHLDAIVRAGLAHGRNMLWCGSAGLAEALVRVIAPGAPPAPAPIIRSVLGLFGSDQDVTARQLDHCARFTVHVDKNAQNAIAGITTRLAQDGAAMTRFRLPDGTSRADAAAEIRDRLGILLQGLPPPGTLVVAGGETLRAICDSFGATHLDATGALQPGVPRSILRGGAWDGVDIISKSGAFGGPHWLADLLRSAGIAFERTGT